MWPTHLPTAIAYSHFITKLWNHISILWPHRTRISPSQPWPITWPSPLTLLNLEPHTNFSFTTLEGLVQFNPQRLPRCLLRPLSFQDWATASHIWWVCFYKQQNLGFILYFLRKTIFRLLSTLSLWKSEPVWGFTYWWARWHLDIIMKWQSKYTV